MQVLVPRPPLFGSADTVPGFGNVYVLFRACEDAEKAKIAVFRRRFNGRVVEASYFPEEKFKGKIFV